MDEGGEPDMGTPTGPDAGSADMGGEGPDTGGPIGSDPDMGGTTSAAAEASCCAQVNSRTYAGWQLLLAGVCFVMVVRRRKSR